MLGYADQTKVLASESNSARVDVGISNHQGSTKLKVQITKKNQTKVLANESNSARVGVGISNQQVSTKLKVRISKS